MSESPSRAPSEEEVWKWLEGEKEIDRRLRKVSYVAWSVTLGIVAIYAVVALIRFGGMVFYQVVQGDGGPWEALIPIFFQALVPLLVVLGLLSVLIAVLSTIGIFLRFRTASFAEIQHRLAALEKVVARPDGEGER